MRESVRLAYLQALGVTNWVPRKPLSLAAARLPADIPDEDIAVALPVLEKQPEKQPEPPSEAIKVAPLLPRAQKPSVTQGASQPESAPVETRPPDPVAPPLEPFSLQLFQAGPCALLVEMGEQGVASTSPEQRLLRDILRAAGLPDSPARQAEFRWPLTRNLQLDRSASSASEALQAFMQARLEDTPVLSIGCFGEKAVLLIDGMPETPDVVLGREEAQEHLPPAWFAPALEVLMADPQEKARLWALLRRVRSRWQEQV